jgi:acyl carrier protein
MLLRERIEGNYEDFKESMIDFDNEILFELAPTIAAVRDAYSLLQENDYISEDDAAYLLKYDNPLKIIADAVRNYAKCTDEDFNDMIADFIEDDDGESYITVDLADELRDKYGDDIPIEAAIMCEIVELGRKLVKC